MLITIGITAYNAQDTIRHAVLSALRQEWPEIEIIIVDDCSTDRTWEILENLQTENPALRIFHLPQNSGVAAARNEIIKHAGGEFLAFFDDDDESTPDRLRLQVARIISYEQTYAQNAPVICHAARDQYYPDHTQRYEPTMGTQQGSLAPHGHAVALRILTGKPAPDIFGSTATCSQMARVSVYRALDGFDENFRRSEDTDFNIRAALAGAHFIGIKEPLVRQKMTLASDKKLAAEKLYALKLLEKYRDFIARNTSYDFCLEWLNAKYMFLEGKKIAFLFKILKLFARYPALTLQRFLWALPNTGFNLAFRKLHR